MHLVFKTFRFFQKFKLIKNIKFITELFIFTRKLYLYRSIKTNTLEKMEIHLYILY